jgi:hypothetical protein
MSKPLNISYSSTSCWKRCAEMFYLQYLLGVQPKEEGASLAFGSAIDTAISFVLLAKKNKILEPSLDKINDMFLNDAHKGWKLTYDTDKLHYTKYDVDLKVFKKDDWDVIGLWERELGVSTEQTRKAFNKKAYTKMSSNEDHMYSRLAWLSLRNKGYLMIEAFMTEIYPEITEVISVQHKIEGRIGESNLIGYIDLICRLKKYEKPVLIDLKTSASQYEFDSIRLSDQLHMYISYAGKQLDTHLVGYAVLLKSMVMDTYCSICGQKKVTQHKNCNAVINGSRCGGTWTEVPKASTQLLVDEIKDEDQEKFLKDLSNVTCLMESRLRFMNRDSCKDFGLCRYYNLCYLNKLDEYKWKSEEDKQNYLKGE